MRTPSIRPRANAIERHHMLYTKSHWIQTPMAQATRNLPAYSISLPRQWHDRLHMVVTPPQRPTNQVVDALYNIGFEADMALDEKGRMDRMIDSMAGFAISNTSPESADQMLEVMSSLEAQMGVYGLWKSMRP